MVSTAHAALPSTRRGAVATRPAAARSAPRPRWCSPWIEGSVLPMRVGDLAGAEADEMAEHEDLALLLGQRRQRLAAATAARSESSSSLVLAALAHLLARDRRGAGACGRPRRCARRAGSTPRTGPRAARTCAGSVMQLREHVLRDVLGLVVVAQQAAHVAVDVVGVAEVEEAERLRSPCLARATARATKRRVSGSSSRRVERRKCPWSTPAPELCSAVEYVLRVPSTSRRWGVERCCGIPSRPSVVGSGHAAWRSGDGREAAAPTRRARARARSGSLPCGSRRRASGRRSRGGT